MTHEKTASPQAPILMGFLQEAGEQRPKECKKCKTPTICEKLIPKGTKTFVCIWFCPKQTWPRRASAKKSPPRRSRRSIPVTQTGIQRVMVSAPFLATVRETGHQ